LSATAQTQPEPGADFGFRFEAVRCLTEKFDTFSGEFTEDLGGEPARSATARFSLTDSQMRAVYQAIENVRFFDLPPVFNGVPPGLGEVWTTVPANTYRLEVRNGGVAHSVLWRDAYNPTTKEADTLRALFSMIVAFIHERPEFERLPRRLGGCE
jgi:hypothetical protein